MAVESFKDWVCDGGLLGRFRAAARRIQHLWQRSLSDGRACLSVLVRTTQSGDSYDTASRCCMICRSSVVEARS